MDSKESALNTVFILGAGASKEGGAPVMSNFLDVAEVLWRTGQIDTVEEHYKVVFEARSKLQAVFAKANLDITNIEDVFAAFEMGDILGSLPGYETEEIEGLIESLVILIVKTIGLTHRYILKPKRRFNPPSPYMDFAKLVQELNKKARPKHNVSILTFNYDIGCEYALIIQGLDLDYCLQERPEKKNCIDVLKLHGSMNWSYNSEGKLTACCIRDFLKTYEPEPRKNETSGIYFFDIGSRLKGCDEFAGVDSPKPFIVPPTWNKTSKYSSIKQIWRKAAEVLSQAENIFISGYFHLILSSDTCMH